MYDVYLGIGSNMGDREKNIISAYLKIKTLTGNIKTASLYETEPMYMHEQRDFLNTVFYTYSDIPPLKLLKAAAAMEDEAGREREKAGFKGPRPLDIDILLYGSMIVDSERLSIPHPMIKERAFVLVPLLELSPELRDPVSGSKYKVFLKNNMKKGVSYYKSPAYVDIIG